MQAGGFVVSYRTAEPAAGESDRHCLRVATPNSIPWSSTAKFSRNGVLVARLRVSYAPLVQSSDLGDAGRKPRFRNGEPAVRLAAELLQLSELTFPRSPYLGSNQLECGEGGFIPSRVVQSAYATDVISGRLIGSRTDQRAPDTVDPAEPLCSRPETTKVSVIIAHTDVFSSQRFAREPPSPSVRISAGDVVFGHIVRTGCRSSIVRRRSAAERCGQSEGPARGRRRPGQPGIEAAANDSWVSSLARAESQSGSFAG